MNDSHLARKGPLKLLILSTLTSAAAGYGLTQTIQGRPWWLLLPVAAFGLMGCEMWRLVRWEKRDMELAALIGHDLDDDVDLTLLNLNRGVNARPFGEPWDGKEPEEGDRR